MRHFRGWGNKHSGMLILRVMLGAFFLAHGVFKFMNLDNAMAMFTGVGIPSFLVYVVSGIEVVGGIALILGVLTCTFGIALAVIQVVAVYKVTGRTPSASALSAFAFGYGMNLVLAAAALGIAFTGPGRMALWQGKCCVGCRRDEACGDCDSCNNCSKCGVESSDGPHMQHGSGQM